MAASGTRLTLPAASERAVLTVSPSSCSRPGRRRPGMSLIQFAQIGGANVVRHGKAQADIVIDLAGQTQLPGLHQTAGGVAGHTAGHVAVQAFDNAVLDDRDIKFGEAFDHIELAAHRHEVAAAQPAGRAVGIGGGDRGFLAVFHAEGGGRRTRPDQIPGQHPLHGGAGRVLLDVQVIEVVIVFDISRSPADSRPRCP